MDKRPQPQGQVQIELGEKEAEGIYSNLALISHSASEFIVDFARVLPGVPKARVYARIVMTPQHVKALRAALDQNIARYEGDHGTIPTPAGEVAPRHIGFTTPVPTEAEPPRTS